MQDYQMLLLLLAHNCPDDHPFAALVAGITSIYNPENLWKYASRGMQQVLYECYDS